MPGNRKIKYLQAFFVALLSAVVCLPNLGYAACGVTKTVKQAAGGDYVSISAAVALAQSSSPLSTDWCINIDSAVYSEQVTVQNISFTHSTNTLTLQTDPVLISTQATINPPSGSTAAFQILNASVTLQSILVISTNAVSFGVYASSANVTISNVTVGDSKGKITTAGIAISNYSSISASSITVQNAHGLYTNGTSNTISNSTISSNGANYSLYLNGASSNTVNGCMISSETYLDSGASYNTIKTSTLTTNSASTLALLLANASNNLITQNYISNINAFGIAVNVSNGSDYNTISGSTMTGIQFNFVSSNTVTQDFVIGQLMINFGDHMKVQSSTLSVIPGNIGPPLYLWAALYNTIDANYISDLAAFGTGVQIWGSAAYNTISRSTIWADGLGLDWKASSNTLTTSYVTSQVRDGIVLNGGANNTISQSTITVNLDGAYPVRIVNGFSNAIFNTYIQGSTAVFVSGSTSTMISGSILVATNTYGSALWLTGNSMSLTLTTDTITGGPHGAGIYMDPGNLGSIALTSNTITDGQWGVYISTMACGACSGNISISSMIFAGGLTAGATAINFAGGTFASTFSFVAFNDPNIAVNVDGAPLSIASRITMSGYSGAKAGPSFENDPNSLIDWVTGGNVPPSNPVISQVFITSVTVGYGTVGAAAYQVDASTSPDFSGTLFSASDLTGTLSSLSPQGLSIDTTYYLRAGAVWSGIPFYANTAPSYTVTLASTPAPLSFTAIGLTQFTVNWAANGNPPNTFYQVDVSTDINFGLIQASSSTTNLTVTFSPVASLTVYYVRVRALNFAGVATAYAVAAVETINGVVTISGDHLRNVWYNNAIANFTAQEAPQPQPWLFHYTITSSPSSPAPSDPVFNGSALTVTLKQGINYFNVLGRNAADTVTIGTATWGPILVDTGAPVIASIAAQNSATDTGAILNGGKTLSNTPRFTWPIANSTSPIVGYSLSLSTDPATVPGAAITTTLNFSDQVLTKSGLYYAKVAALNLAGNLGPAVGMSFTYNSVPSAAKMVLKNNYFNPTRGECTVLQVQAPSGGKHKIELFTLLGDRVLTLADQEVSPGTYNYSWCGRNADNSYVASGAYLLHVETSDQKKNYKVIVLK